jgi:hypothetical protein
MWIKFKQFLIDFFLDERLISLIAVLFISSSIGFGALAGLILTVIVMILSSGLYWILKKLTDKTEE